MKRTIEWLKNKKGRYLTLLTLGGIVAVYVLWNVATFFSYAGGGRLLRKVVLVEENRYYKVEFEGGRTLFLVQDSIHGDSLSTSLAPHSRKDYTTGFFVSEAGHLVTSNVRKGKLRDNLSEREVKALLEEEKKRKGLRRAELKNELGELDYYRRTHSVTDEGYNEIMALRERVSEELRQTDSICKILAVKAAPKAVPLSRYFLVYSAVRENDTTVCTRKIPAHLEKEDADGILLQTHNRRLPSGAKTFIFHLVPYGFFGAEGKMNVQIPALETELRAVQSVERTAKALPALQHKNDTFSPLSAGAPVVDERGNIVGYFNGNKQVGERDLQRLLGSGIGFFPRLWYDLAGFFNGLFRADDIHGTVRADGDETVVVRRIVYPGKGVYLGHVRAGKRNGFGEFRAKEGAVYAGVWQSDSLPRGTKVGDGAFYKGGFSRDLRRQGYGEWQSLTSRKCYAGNWQEDKRHGMGYAVSPISMVRSGEWKNDAYLGERMNFTAHRVYGIDISRYQHEEGKRRFRFNWDALRIVGVGKGRASVNFPIDFVYIKATEGQTVYNKYYAADLQAARQRKVPVGAYHFFTKSDGVGQARFFLQKARIAKGDLPPMLDVEPSEAQIKEMGGEARMFANIVEWMRIVSHATGTKPILYISQMFVNRHYPNAPQELKQCPVWIARYGEYRPYVKLLYWQLTPYGRISAVNTEVDVNVFNGSKEDFREYLRENTVR